MSQRDCNAGRSGVMPPTEPKPVTSDQLLRRAIVLLASEHPELSERQLGHVLIDKAVDAFAEMTDRSLAPTSRETSR